MGEKRLSSNHCNRSSRLLVALAALAVLAILRADSAAGNRHA